MPSAFSYPLEAASNVVITSVTDGQALVWDNATSRWVNGTAGLTQEQVDDRVAALLVPGTNITLTYNDPAGTITIDAASGTPGVTLEEVDDHLATAIIPGIGIEVTYDDAANEFQFDRIETLIADTDGATITIDLAFDTGGEHHEVTLGGNRTLVFANPTEGEKFRIKINQDATGGRTVTWPSGITWVNGYSPAQTPVPSSGDTLELLCTNVGGYGTTYLGWILSTERPKIVSATAHAACTASVTTTTQGGGGGAAAVFSVFGGDSTLTDINMEAQSIAKTGTVSGGTFTLTGGEFGEWTTAAIPYNATALQIVDAINAAANSASAPQYAHTTTEDAVISSGGTVVIVFHGGSNTTNLPNMTISSSLTGGGSYSVSNDHHGSGGANTQTGTFTLACNGTATSSLSASSNAAAVQSALETIVGSGNVTVTTPSAGNGALRDGYRIAFVAALGAVTLTPANQTIATGSVMIERQQAGAAATNEVHTLSITGTPVSGSIVLTILGQAVTLNYDDSASEAETAINAVLGSGSVDVTGGPLPGTALVIEFIGANAGTNVASSSVDDDGIDGHVDIDWSVCQAVNITLGSGSGTYRVGHVKPVPGTWMHAEITNSGATVSAFEWTGVTLDWDTAGEPTMPTTGNTLAVEFYAVSTTLIRGRTWYP